TNASARSLVLSCLKASGAHFSPTPDELHSTYHRSGCPTIRTSFGTISPTSSLKPLSRSRNPPETRDLLEEMVAGAIHLTGLIPCGVMSCLSLYSSQVVSAPKHVPRLNATQYERRCATFASIRTERGLTGVVFTYAQCSCQALSRRFAHRL